VRGHRAGGQVVILSALLAGVGAWLDLRLSGDVSLAFDLAFIVLCVAAALMVRRRDFFTVGVLPPLLMLATVLLLAATARETVAEEVDPLVQAVVSGLATHAGALVAGYSLALTVLALRQVALRNEGLLRNSRRLHDLGGRHDLA
jgi:hypothetical protein